MDKILKASLVLYIACTLRARCVHAMLTLILEAVRHCQIHLLYIIEALKLVTIEIESRSQIPSLRLRRRHQCTWLIDDARTILTTFTIFALCYYAATGDMVKFFINHNFIIGWPKFLLIGTQDIIILLFYHYV